LVAQSLCQASKNSRCSTLVGGYSEVVEECFRLRHTASSEFTRLAVSTSKSIVAEPLGRFYDHGCARSRPFASKQPRLAWIDSVLTYTDDRRRASTWRTIHPTLRAYAWRPSKAVAPRRCRA